jgi:hypothetical protein
VAVAQARTVCKLKNILANHTNYKGQLHNALRVCKMSLNDLKLYFINTATLGVTTFAQIEMSLKILLLVVTIGYTITKWVDLKKNKK